jgi:2-polyprenyl-3-methyl-5-hydroxy-6-metoxy-1,4-benzoquinol methylase
MPVKYKSTALKEWNERTSFAVARKYNRPEFDGVLKKILPVSSKMTCLEIGAIPGGFLAYFNKEFKYKITGIDFAKNKKVFIDTMKINKIKNYEFINADIEKLKINKKFDVVSSFGFIEHFDDYDKIIQKHIDLIDPNGYLVLSLPNFRNLQYLYRIIFDRENLKIHNLDSMKIRKLNSILKSKGMQKLYSGYLGGIELWYDTPIKNKFIYNLRYNITVKTNNKFKNKLPNSRLYSPIILLVYKKPS